LVGGSAGGRLLVGFGALMRHVNTVAFGEPYGRDAADQASYAPLYGHLAIVLVAGIYLPAALVHWFQAIAVLFG